MIIIKNEEDPGSSAGCIVRQWIPTPGREETGKPGGRDIVDLIARYILELQLDDLRVIKIKDIAGKFNINPSFLSRKFKARHNYTLCAFIQMEKIQRAVTLLQQVKSLRIDELSERLGYSSTEYFIRSFKKKMGVPPNIYRKCRNCRTK